MKELTPEEIEMMREARDNATRAAGSSALACSATDLLLAAILLGRFSPLAPHHAGAIRERLRELNDNELREMVATGKWPNSFLDVQHPSNAQQKGT